MSRSGVRVIDHGFKKTVERIKGVAGRTVVVGFLEGDRELDGTPVAEVAAHNEFGTATAPARPFLRPTVDENLRAIGDVEAAGFGLVVDGTLEADDLYKLIGENLVRKVVAKIDSGVGPANAPSTIAHKGDGRTLRESGTMRDTVSFEVRPSRRGGR